MNVSELTMQAVCDRVQEELTEATISETFHGTYEAIDRGFEDQIGYGSTPFEALEDLARVLFDYYGYPA